MPNQPPTQDLVTTVDFTASADIDATKLNLSLSTLNPNAANDNNAALGLNIVTTDTAANTPLVPDPTAMGAAKWKFYTWTRKPFAGSVDKTVIIYGWNDDAPHDATFAKWVSSRPDLTAINTQLSNNTTDVASAVIVANQAAADASNALEAANSADTTAAAANNTATAAQNTANAASANATTAINNATTAQTLATNANNTAAAAAVTANTASAAVTGLLGSNSIFGAWVKFTWAAGVANMLGNNNVVSVARVPGQGVGYFRITFLKAFNNALTGMAILGSAQALNDAGLYCYVVCPSNINPTCTTAYVDVMTFANNALSDPINNEVHVGVIGTLAGN